MPIRVGARNDISYGIYLYGWPLQQLTVLAVGTSGGILVHSAAALVGARGLSWWFVEKPALSLGMSAMRHRSG